MQKQTYFARSFFFAAFALLLTLSLAPKGFASDAIIADDEAVAVQRPPAPAGCEGLTTPVCAEADIGGFIYKYYFKP